MNSITTNEWHSTVTHMPWPNRTVLCRFADDSMRVLKWNGYYWVDPATNTRLLFDQEREPTHFYIFEKFINNN